MASTTGKITETRLILNLLGGSRPAWNLVPGDARLFHGGTGAAGAPFKYHERPSPARQPDPAGRASSPASRFAVLEDPGAIGGDAAPLGLGEHPLRRLVDRLVGEVEGAPVNAEERARPQVNGRPHRLLGRQVDGAHDLGRLVRAYRHRREVEGTEPLAPLGEASEVPGVAAEIETA